MRDFQVLNRHQTSHTDNALIKTKHPLEMSLQNITLSKVQGRAFLSLENSHFLEAKLREEAAQLISRWKEEKINFFGPVNREVMEKKKKKGAFAASKKVKEPGYFLTVVVLGGYRMWLMPVQQDTTAKQTVLVCYYLAAFSCFFSHL